MSRRSLLLLLVGFLAISGCAEEPADSDSDSGSTESDLGGTTTASGTFSCTGALCAVVDGTGATSVISWPAGRTQPDLSRFDPTGKRVWGRRGTVAQGYDDITAGTSFATAGARTFLATGHANGQLTFGELTARGLEHAPWSRIAGGKTGTTVDFDPSVPSWGRAFGQPQVAAGSGSTYYVLVGVDARAMLDGPNDPPTPTFDPARSGLQLVTCTATLCTRERVAAFPSASFANTSIVRTNAGVVVAAVKTTEPDVVHVFTKSGSTWLDSAVSVPGAGAMAHPHLAFGGGRTVLVVDQTTSLETSVLERKGAGWREIGKLPVSHPGTQIAVSSSDVTIFVHREVQRGGYDYRLWRTYRQSHAFSPDAIDPMDDGGQRLGALAPSGKLSVIPNSSGEVSSEIGPTLAIDSVSAPIDLARGPGAREACLRSLPGTIAMSTLATPGACLVEPTLRDVSVKGTSLLPIQVIGGTITFSAGAAPASLEWTSLAATKIVARDRALSVDHVYLEGGRDHDSLDTGSLDFRANAALGIANATFRGSWVGALGSSAVKLDRVAFDRPRLVAFSLHAVPPSPAALVPATLDLNRVEVTSYFPALDVLGATVHIDGLTYQGAASKPRPAGTTSTSAPAVLLARSSGFVHHTTIRASGGDGILLDNVGELEITDTTVTDSAKHGIEVVSDVPPLLGPCRPVKTMSPVNEGRFPPYSPDPHLARCVVSRNGGAGVEISGPHILMLIEQSTFERNVAEGVAIRSGRGFSQGGADLTCPSGERDGRDVDVPLNPGTSIRPDVFKGNGAALGRQFFSDHRVGTLDLRTNDWSGNASVTCTGTCLR